MPANASETTKPAKPPRDPRLDIWGLKPVAPGFVRGRVTNLRRNFVEAQFGPMQVVDFDLDPGEGKPLIPVRMEGNDFSSPLLGSPVGEVPDPDPSVRPIVVTYMRIPKANEDDGYWASYYPGRDVPNRRREMIGGLAMVLGPIVGFGLLALLVWAYLTNKLV